MAASAGAGCRSLRKDECDGPFGPWLRRLRGTHVGRVLHAMTTAWCADDEALPRRTKWLRLAVGDHGLDDEPLSDRVQAMLTTQCGLASEEVRTAVTHLRGDAVRPREEALLPSARASILYEAGRIQDVVRA